jgi:hypothetical protein
MTQTAEQIDKTLYHPTEHFANYWKLEDAVKALVNIIKGPKGEPNGGLKTVNNERLVQNMRKKSAWVIADYTIAASPINQEIYTEEEALTSLNAQIALRQEDGYRALGNIAKFTYCSEFESRKTTYFLFQAMVSD